MPVMNGIEATQRIKINSPKTMIIALSCLDDEKKQKEILSAGAEDYVNKPINALLFNSRLKNYLSVLDSRSHIDVIDSAKNLFSSKIYNHKITFCISTEDHLAEFWESILIRMNLLKELENGSDLVRLIYEIGGHYLHGNYTFKIIIEEDESNYYFTLTNAHLVPKKLIDRLIEKNFPSLRNIFNDKKLSILLSKKALSQKIETPTEEEPIKEQSIQELTLTSSLEKTEYKTYDFLQSDEIEEFEDSLYKLHAIINALGTQECTLAEIQTINSYFNEMKKVLIQNSESYAIATAIEELSTTIKTYPQEFIQMAKDIQAIALGFIDDLISWKEMIFYEGAPSLDFMDDSIVANAKILQDLLNPPEVKEEELDDIFAF